MIFGRNAVYVLAALKAGVALLVIFGVFPMTVEQVSSLNVFLEAALVLYINQELTGKGDVQRVADAAQGALDAKNEEIAATREAASSGGKGTP